ncbi:exodeoxyribonuclease V subunit gamma [Nocardioides terrisoli]|uniref:exodeoxyribonuclease V subunit gamma n=1 Tax=Nocardioides terrisoli TaxID=3388267 RepID=UPI00287BB5DA|nr:exodeoxyribonuclease V subunit gamma [Nocardioides marmorisolisilvae]
MAFTVHRAVRADLLAEGLAQLLGDPLPDPFARELVIVPARGVERWLSQRLSHYLGTSGRDDGVCAAVDFRTPHSLVAELTGTTDADPWTPDALVWPLLRVIDDASGQEWAQVLATHLGHGLADEREAALRRGRRFTVARRLAGIFASYAVQRPALLDDWESGRDTDGCGDPLPEDLRWQAELWRRTVATVGVPTPCARHRAAVAALREGRGPLGLPPRISLFGHTTMTATELELLAALGEHRDVHLWLPHPSPGLWDDREPRHPLLATLGRDVRELQQGLDRVGAVDEDGGAVPPLPDTLLGHLQSAIATDTRPVPVPVRAEDDTVQVHACHGPSRQVEVLREVVLGLLADHPDLELRDIVVMCPDVERYAPLVGAAFGLGDAVAGSHPGQQLRVMLADRSPVQTNPLLGVLGTVLDLADGRVSASAVLDLLAAEPVRRRFGLTESDLETVTGWVGRAGIRWAYDEEHRAELGLPGIKQNTWRFGLDRILAGVALSDDSDLWLGSTLPLDDVASTSIGLAGRLAEALDRLQGLTEALRGDHAVSDLVLLLAQGVEQLTAASRGEEWQLAQLHRELAGIAEAAEGAGDRLHLSLADVRALLHRKLAGRPTRASFRTGALTVCTLTPMRSVPHRVVCLLGLDDEVFPRRPSRDGDDLLVRNRRPGERDPRSQDRQLLLDAVMAAGSHLVITYTGFHEATGHARPPAVPLQELLDVLRTTAPDREPVTCHRSQSFHPDYLRPDGLVERGGRHGTFSFDPGAAGAATAATGERAAVPSLADLDLGTAPVTDIDVADLVDAVVNPVRAFLRRRLRLELPWEDEQVRDALPVDLRGLDEWQVGDRMLHELLAGRTPQDALQAEWRRGALPPGRYGWRIAKRVCDQAGPLVEVAEACRQGIAPSAVDLDVDLGDGRRLVGTVPGLHGDRLVRVGFSRLRAKQRLEAWVALVALGVAGRYGTIAGTVGRGSGGAERATYRLPDDPAAVLRDLVALHDAALTAPLPLAPDTARVWVRGHRSAMKPWQIRRDAEKEWRRESRSREFRRTWGRPPAFDEVAEDPRFDRWARVLWEAALDRESR